MITDDAGAIAGAFGYWRETGEFVLFKAPAVVLATGGIGKSFKVTSNSWECTGDGMALALRAGSKLLNMEFVQFHPTGMVWPPSVKGILVTEGVRGDGGVLKNSEGKRFMFDYVPDVFRAQYADNEAEADAWYKDPDHNKRTPDLLPRDEVARAINSEVKAGRGSPHGGVFLDIASRLPTDEILKRLPSMHHQFKELADVDITAEPMEVGPTCHYVMGGIEVEPDTRGGDRRARPVRVRRGGRRHARLEPARRQLAVGPAGLRPPRRRAARPRTSRRSSGKYPAITDAQVDGAASRSRSRRSTTRRRRREPVHDPPGTAAGDERPGRHHPQGRTRSRTRSSRLGEAQGARGATSAVEGDRQFNPGWHLALDLRNMLAVSECIAQGRADARGVARRSHPRRLPGDVARVAPGEPDLLADDAGDDVEVVEAADAADASRPARTCSSKDELKKYSPTTRLDVDDSRRRRGSA